MKAKFNLEAYFSDKEIIKILCLKRALTAKKAHDIHFLRNISKDAKKPHSRVSKNIYQFFLPRSSWIRLNKEERSILDTHSIEVNAIQLERTVWRERKKVEKLCYPVPEWLKNLKELVIDIQKSVIPIESSYRISTPNTIPVLKDKIKKEFRPISSFDLKDLVIIGQISKYLTFCFDPLFLNCSYAFRSSRKGEKTLNHHEAIRKIIAYNHKHDTSVYVSECDIKKFYDCVNHSIIRKRFAEFIVRANSELGLTIDHRAVRIFHSYLNCFSFNKDIFEKEKDLLIKKGIKEGTIPWISHDDLIDIGSDPATDRIGIPQGGALSCLIANIILDSVDRKTLSLNDDNIFYARFCDDMVLLHPQKDVCNKAFILYQSALKEVKLISHSPQNFEKYSSDFWGDKIKSKSPYKWDKFENGDDAKQANVPWLSFVGYQVRYDNLIRIRKKSIEKELKKQVSETDKIINLIKRGKKVSIYQLAIRFRLQQRLISMAVGRIEPGKEKKPSMCWSSGFVIAKENSCIKAQFSKLDRNRERQIERLSRFISKIETPVSESKKKIRPLKYYGYRYSYYKQFV